MDGYVGFDLVEKSIDARGAKPVPDLSHAQVQTLLAGIGNFKGYDVWIPTCDVCKLEWSLTRTFKLRETIPSGFDQVSHILCEIDVVWVGKGRNSIESLFEVEHSTSIYSGLLRFNDLLLTNPDLSHFSIVSNDSRRSAFARQLFRPTFQRRASRS